MEERYELFERYLEGDLSDQEQMDFESKLKSDSNLAEEFEMYKSVRSEISVKIESEDKLLSLKETLDALNTEHFKEVETEESQPAEAKVVRMNRRVWLTVAAAAAVLIAVFLVFNPFQSEWTNQYADLPTANFSERGTPEDDLLIAAESYNAGDYKKAVGAFTTYLATNPDDAEAHLFKALSMMGNSEYEDAIDELETIQSGNSLFVEDAQWYRAIAYLQLGLNDKCLVVLSQIEKGSRWFGKAQNLKDKLE